MVTSSSFVCGCQLWEKDRILLTAVSIRRYLVRQYEPEDDDDDDEDEDKRAAEREADISGEGRGGGR